MAGYPLRWPSGFILNAGGPEYIILSEHREVRDGWLGDNIPQPNVHGQITMPCLKYAM